MNLLKVNISEIFYSIQGEGNATGIPTVFVRLIGCPLRCSYCDTAYAFYGKNLMTFNEVLTNVKKYNCKNICITGGEPLAQKNSLALLDFFDTHNYKIVLETSGTIDISKVNKNVVVVMDIKTPSSGEVDKNLFDNLAYLKIVDQIKFVIADKEDFDWSVKILQKISSSLTILFSPVYEKLATKKLAKWVLDARIDVKIQVQLHKVIWGDIKGV